MCSPRPSAEARRRRSAGFTLIELMIGVVIGLLATLAVTHVLVNSEGQKRTTTSGSDAQVNGALALSTLQRSLQPAGYGLTSLPSVVGCTITGTFSGNTVTSTLANFPTVLAPVVITNGASGAPDSIRILSSGKTTYSVPLRVVTPGYTAGGSSFPVASFRGIDKGDIVLAAPTSTSVPTTACELFQVTDDPSGAPPAVPRANNAWNATNTPATTYGDGAVLFNLGAPRDLTYSIGTLSLVVNTLTIGSDANSTPSYSGNVELFPNIVQLQAMYGKDTNGDGNVDTWDNTTPTTNAGWLQVIAVRIAVVARSSQYEKENVTSVNSTGNGIDWDVGNSGTVSGSFTCNASKCLSIKLDNLTDWQHYRYKLFETVVPLRNLLWNS